MVSSTKNKSTIQLQNDKKNQLRYLLLSEYKTGYTRQSFLEISPTRKQKLLLESSTVFILENEALCGHHSLENCPKDLNEPSVLLLSSSIKVLIHWKKN